MLISANKQLLKLYNSIFGYFFLRNDIALLRLAGPIYDSGYVAIANLPYPDQTLPHGFTCYITGWGLVDCEYTWVLNVHIYTPYMWM